ESGASFEHTCRKSALDFAIAHSSNPRVGCTLHSRAHPTVMCDRDAPPSCTGEPNGAIRRRRSAKVSPGQPYHHLPRPVKVESRQRMKPIPNGVPFSAELTILLLRSSFSQSP